MAKIRFLWNSDTDNLDSYFIGKDFIVVEKVENLDMFSSKPTIKFEINEPKSNLAILIASLKGNNAVYSDNDGYCMLYNVVNITVEPTYYVPGDHRTIVTVDFLASDRYTYNNIKENINTTYIGTDWGTSLTDHFAKITCGPKYGPNLMSNVVTTCADDTVDGVNGWSKHFTYNGDIGWKESKPAVETGVVTCVNGININGVNIKCGTRKTDEKSLENLDNKKENKNMRKINNNELTQIVINEKDKAVTVITEPKLVLKKEKKVTIAKCHKDDEFDPYIGAALAIAYQLFGSKTQFHKYVDNEAKNVDKIRAKKEASKEKTDTSKKIDPEKKKKIELEKLKFFEDLIIKEINERFEPKK